MRSALWLAAGVFSKDSGVLQLLGGALQVDERPAAPGGLDGGDRLDLRAVGPYGRAGSGTEEPRLATSWRHCLGIGHYHQPATGTSAAAQGPPPCPTVAPGRARVGDAVAVCFAHEVLPVLVAKAFYEIGVHVGPLYG